MNRFLMALLASVSLTVLCVAPAAAQYPERSVRMVVPYPPGGPTDITARLVAQKLTQSLGRPFVIENVPGAGGNIGAIAFAKAAPDGYTLLVNAAAHVINMTLYPTPGFDIKRDFSHVSLLVTAPLIMLVHPSVPAKNLQELIALAKARPGQLSYASSSVGGSPHLATEMLKTMTGTRIVHIPYRGAAPALNDLAGGQVQLMLDSMVTGLQFANNGRARALAVTGARRSPMAPDLPTFAEAGVPGFEAYTWYGVSAPAGTPPAIVRLLNTEINNALRLPDVRQRLLDLGTEPASTSVEEFNRFMDSEAVKWAAIVKSSGAKLD